MKEIEEMVIEIAEILSDSNCDDCRKLTLVDSILDYTNLTNW
jgi:hypothetical protein